MVPVPDNDQETTYEFESYIDRDYLVETLVDLLQVDTAVPLGPETLMEPDHPKLVHFVQDVLRPKLREIGVHDIIELPKNQIAVEVGRGETDECVIVQAYTPAQHHNLMDDPFAGKIAIPDDPEIDEPCAWGQGADQNKAHFAAMLTLLKAFADAGETFDGTAYIVANNEARSTHECTRALLSELPTRPNRGLLLMGGGNDIKVSNRGRVDVVIHVEGEAAHSSVPSTGANAIMGAHEVMDQIDDMEFTKTHPDLGGQHAIPYQVVYDPVAPHTLPGYAEIRIDRRLLPGDDVDEAVDDIRSAVGGVPPFDVTVERDVVMEPSVVDPDDEIVEELQGAIASVDGGRADLTFWKSAFDAGGLTNEGIPTVMWGRPERNQSVLGDDWVTLSGGEEEALIVGRMLSNALNG